MSKLLLLWSDIDDYLADYQKKFSPHSLAVKRYSLTQFYHFLEKKEIECWEECNERVIRHYLMYRAKGDRTLGLKPLKANSIQTQLASIRLFFTFLKEKGKLSLNYAQLVNPPKGAKRLPKVVEVELLERILNYVPQNSLEIRDLAICELFYSSGLRLAELAALNLKDLDLEEASVRILDGKGGKDRILPVGEKAKAALECWFTKREIISQTSSEETGEKAVFLSQRGRRLSTRQISTRVKELAMKAGININLHPHLLRHSMATHMLEASGDIRLVQELLGHADISTTQVYTHLDFGHLAKVYDAAHPRAKKEQKQVSNNKTRPIEEG